MRKSRTLTIRITEAQFRMLTDFLVDEEFNRSHLIREMIEKYNNGHRKKNKNDVTLKTINNPVATIKK